MPIEFTPGDHLDSFGHHFIVGLSGATLDKNDKDILKRLRPSGVLLLQRNFLAGPLGTVRRYDEWLPALKYLLDEARKYSEREEWIVSIDHEGGRVHRTPPPISAFPYARHYSSQSEEVAKVMAQELRSIGVNVLWGPVADVHSNPKNPVIGERAFSTDIDTVSDRATRFANALRDGGVLPCAKHFPGHGDTELDSHFELPKVDRTCEELEQSELGPFKALLGTNIPLVMTAHILFPKIDPQAPATLSSIILKGILRDELGFDGAIVSDDIEMKALASFAKTDLAARCLDATCDLILISRHLHPNSDNPLRIAKDLGTSVVQRKVSEETLHASFLRVKRLLEMLPKNPVEALPEATLRINNQFAGELVKEAKSKTVVRG